MRGLCEKEADGMSDDKARRESCKARELIIGSADQKVKGSGPNCEQKHAEATGGKKS
jgi:hypothetical protein